LLQSSACNGKSGRRELSSEGGETFSETNPQSVAGKDSVTAAAECRAVSVWCMLDQFQSIINLTQTGAMTVPIYILWVNRCLLHYPIWHTYHHHHHLFAQSKQ